MNKGRLGLAMRLAGVGWFVAICIVGGLLLGIWLDSLFNTKVLFTLLGLGLGLVVAFLGVYRLLYDVLSSKSNGAGDS